VFYCAGSYRLYAEDNLEWPTLLKEADDEIQRAMVITDKFGTKNDKDSYSKFKQEIEKAILERDGDLLRKRIDQMNDFSLMVYREQPEFWVGCFDYAKENKSSMKDVSMSEQLIIKGERAIQNNDLEGLKLVVQNLYDLLPIAQQQSMGFGGNTYKI